MGRPRVGHIQFLNCMPLYYGLVKNGILLDVELTKGTPTELNRWLIEGGLDISPISAIEYARNAKDLLLLPKLTVSSDGEVKSILLVSKVPAEELHGRKVALTNTSSTSQALVKIILQDKYGVDPVYFECPPDLPNMLHEAHAALLIGDSALRALYEAKNLYIYDLGGEWKALNGRRMVYAVWAARRKYAERYPELVAEVYRRFIESMDYSVLNVSAIARDAARWEPFDAKFLEDYFLSLKFDLDEDYQADFLAFLTRAEELGYLDEVPKLDFVRTESIEEVL
ncbi:MAG: menaquinone biosynthetic enzyme MqnA/MqnD family protein [Candidatus Aquicultorales bacterium]